MTWAVNGATRFGLVLPQGWRDADLEGRDFARVVGLAAAAERVGFDSIWLYDHLQTRAGDPAPLLECWTTLAALARETSHVRLGQIVTCALYRNAGLLAQMAATVDAASGDRVVVGLGAGWDEREYLAFGYGATYPTVAERLAHLERTLQDVHSRWSGPVLVGGAGERVLLRHVARHADACNLTDTLDPAYYAHKLAVLRAHCEDVGRDYETILRTATLSVDAAFDPEVLAPVVATGISYVVLYLAPPVDVGAVERLATRLRLR